MHQLPQTLPKNLEPLTETQIIDFLKSNDYLFANFKPGKTDSKTKLYCIPCSNDQKRTYDIYRFRILRSISKVRSTRGMATLQIRLILLLIISIKSTSQHDICHFQMMMIQSFADFNFDIYRSSPKFFRLDWSFLCFYLHKKVSDHISDLILPKKRKLKFFLISPNF